jgi:hypothetical protein
MWLCKLLLLITIMASWMPKPSIHHSFDTYTNASSSSHAIIDFDSEDEEEQEEEGEEELAA